MAIGSNYYQYGTPRSNPGPNNKRHYSFPNAKGRNGDTAKMTEGSENPEI